MAEPAGRGVVAWRMLAVAAFAATAAGAVVLTRVPAQHTTLGASEAAAACDSSLLATTIGSAPGQGSIQWGMHGRYYTLQFKNISSRPCSLEGYPDVAAYYGPQPAGSPATLDTSVDPRPVTLAPGASAQSVLEYRGTGGFQPDQCRQVTATDLRVFLPRQLHAMMIPFGLPVCSRRGPRVLSVQPIQPKPAIPGFHGM